jgi:hypothetical protein
LGIEIRKKDGFGGVSNVGCTDSSIGRGRPAAAFSQQLRPLGPRQPFTERELEDKNPTAGILRLRARSASPERSRVSCLLIEIGGGA